MQRRVSGLVHVEPWGGDAFRVMEQHRLPPSPLPVSTMCCATCCGDVEARGMEPRTIYIIMLYIIVILLHRRAHQTAV